MGKIIGVLVVAVAIASLAFVSCGKTKQQEVASCQLEGYKLYANKPEMGSGSITSTYTQVCMEAKGYTFDPANKGCPGLGTTSEVSGTPNMPLAISQITENCYNPPKHLFSRLF